MHSLSFILFKELYACVLDLRTLEGRNSDLSKVMIPAIHLYLCINHLLDRTQQEVHSIFRDSIRNSARLVHTEVAAEKSGCKRA